MAFRKIEAGLVHADVDQFIGKPGTIFYDNSLGDFRISDGATPGGIALSFGGGDGGTYTLPTATTTVKGGVKIDGSTITIANQVISVGTVPYSSLSGTPTIPTNNNQLTNGAAYITSAALSGLATETYVTTRGYLTTVAYADVTGKPTLFSGSYADLTNKPTIPTNNNELTNGAGYITSSSLTGLATETYVTTRGYITSAALSGYALTGAIPTDISQLTDTNNLLGTGGGGGGTTYITNTVENPFTFSIAGDDSTLREISNGESIKFTGAGGVAVTTDAEGAITITQGTTSSLVNGANTVSLGSDGVLTIPPNGLIIASTGPYGYQHEMRLGDGLMIGQDGGLANYKNVTWSLNGQNSDSGTQIRLPGQADSDNGLSLLIQHQYANSSIDIESYGNIWSFGFDGLLTFPDGTKQSTAPAITIAADDSTQRTIYLGEESIKFVGASGITTASDAEGNITITGPSLAGLATESYVTSRGYITGLSYNDLTDKPNLAGTYSWSIAADDSTQLEISAGNLVKIVGTRGVTTTSNADGQITITGPDLSTYATQSYVNAALSSAGITISATVPVGLSDGALWYNSSNLELYVRYDNAWVAASSSSSADTDYNDLINKPTNVSQFANDADYVSRDEVYAMILELTS